MSNIPVKRDYSPERGSRPIGGLLGQFKRALHEWMNDKVMKLSASLSLYALLSLAPLMVITIKIVSLIWRDQDVARGHVLAQLTGLMGSQAAAAIQTVLDNSTKPNQGLLATLVSTIILLFSATGVFIELQDSMNSIWHVETRAHSGVWGFVRHRLLSAAMVFGIVFLLLTSMFVSTILSAVAKHIAGEARWVVFIVDLIVSFGIVAVLFASMYRVLPEHNVWWRDVWVGALVSSAMFTVGKYALTLYFKYGTPTSAFGAAGSLAAVMLWVYYSSFILFFGAELAKVRSSVSSPSPSQQANHLSESNP